jgi:hypothetical protein
LKQDLIFSLIKIRDTIAIQQNWCAYWQDNRYHGNKKDLKTYDIVRYNFMRDNIQAKCQINCMRDSILAKITLILTFRQYMIYFY